MTATTIITCHYHPDVELTEVILNLPPIRLPGTPRYLGHCQRCADEDGVHTPRYSHGHEIKRLR